MGTVTCRAQRRAQDWRTSGRLLLLFARLGAVASPGAVSHQVPRASDPGPGEA